MSSTHQAAERVHEQHSATLSDLWTPPHPPRRPTALWRATHRRLIVEEDRPCAWCRVRHSDLLVPGVAGVQSAQNPRGARQLELHHHPVERSLVRACDWHKLSAVFPEVTSGAAMLRWIDSEGAVIPLCDWCHRGPFGIHHLCAVAAAAHPFLLDNYWITVGKSPQWEAAEDARRISAAGMDPHPGDPA